MNRQGMPRLAVYGAFVLFLIIGFVLVSFLRNRTISSSVDWLPFLFCSRMLSFLTGALIGIDSLGPTISRRRRTEVDYARFILIAFPSLVLATCAFVFLAGASLNTAVLHILGGRVVDSMQVHISGIVAGYALVTAFLTGATTVCKAGLHGEEQISKGGGTAVRQ